MESRDTVAIEAVRTGAAYASEHFRSDLAVEQKSSKTDVVTEIDRSTQHRIISAIDEYFPNDAIVGEEEDERKTVPEDGYAWIIDPIDGTQNYVRGIRAWVTSVAVVRDGEPINAINAAPALCDHYRATPDGTTRNGWSISVSTRTDPETFAVAPTLRWTRANSATVGALADEIVNRFGELRRIGSAQLTLSLVASGAIDAVVAFDPEPNPWDTVAGAYLIDRAGGTVTDVHGDEWTPHSRGLVASNGEAHDALLDAVRTATDRSSVDEQ
ncbi:inositol monophosphatase family protein [Halegenticoccus tardaugens]|uniref:inositol monophosphatase family protein n=1 Tax=Halegenticoccus tardaugens TaxID=2071624 RepID=UPI00100BBAF7|nr:inositol monophosphatase [Halegenticoccus tardaugens]